MRRIHGSWFVTVVALVLGVALGALAVHPARAGTVVVLPRPGQVGVSLSGMYGTLLGSGNLVSDQFGSGPGMAVRLRYRMRYERGFGLTFEGHGLDARAVERQTDILDPTVTLDPSSEFGYKRLNLFLYGADFYQLFGTRTKTTKLVSIGGGIAHPVFALNDGENEFALGDGAYLSAGAGVERFFWQSLAADLGVRYHAVFLDGKLSHDVQFHAGFIMYASL